MEDDSQNGLGIKNQTNYDGKQQYADTIINNHNQVRDGGVLAATVAVGAAICNLAMEFLKGLFDESVDILTALKER